MTCYSKAIHLLNRLVDFVQCALLIVNQAVPSTRVKLQRTFQELLISSVCQCFIGVLLFSWLFCQQFKIFWISIQVVNKASCLLLW